MYRSSCLSQRKFPRYKPLPPLLSQPCRLLTPSLRRPPLFPRSKVTRVNLHPPPCPSSFLPPPRQPPNPAQSSPPAGPFHPVYHNAQRSSPPPLLIRNVLASPLPLHAYIRVCFACSGRPRTEEEEAGALLPASSLQAPLAIQLQLRCNTACLAEHAVAPVPGLEKHNPAPRGRVRKPADSQPQERGSARRWRETCHSVCATRRQLQHENGRGSLFFKARSLRAFPFCICKLGDASVLQAVQ